LNTADGKTISLVLGSGGARGLAHIGVIRVLEQQGWKVGAIAGEYWAQQALERFAYDT
jgi:NTE family protein